MSYLNNLLGLAVAAALAAPVFGPMPIR